MNFAPTALGTVRRLRGTARRGWPGSLAFGAVIAILDADGDGRLDLFIAAAIAGPHGVRDALLRNHGDGVFEDVTRTSGFSLDRASLARLAATSTPMAGFISTSQVWAAIACIATVGRRDFLTSRRRRASVCLPRSA